MEELFTSRAKFKVLEYLSKYQKPSYVREIELLTGLPVRSIQLALADLSEAKILEKSYVQNRVYYRFNIKHPLASTVVGIFNLITNEALLRRAKIYSKIAPGILQTNSELNDMIFKGKKV